jgi:DNA polymerase
MSELLTAYKDETLGCTRCPLAATRTQVVFGSGDANAELMFVGEAPATRISRACPSSAGPASCSKLLNGIGLTRAGLHRNVLKGAPARQPRPAAGGDEACGRTCSGRSS